MIGSGPNGLAAAITLARAGLAVAVREEAAEPGGGTRSAELTLPGFVHDVCSAIHPLVPGSPFLRTLPLTTHGLDLIESPSVLAHPLDDGTAVVVERSVEATAAGLGEDGEAYRRLLGPLTRAWENLEASFLGPVVRPPRHPLALARFALHALRPAEALARARFVATRAKALFAGCAAHSMLPLGKRPSAGFGLVLLMAGHRFGWPFPRGGSQRIADALVAVLRYHGGDVETGSPVRSLGELGGMRPVLCDVGPHAFLRLAGSQLP
ncbi:MAG TPA: NAD(P)/FAD-dependent oxidoreductase, partial [Gaiellaceae bacterium]|nr:NAD(P)/FAD-dependent oxidoreductase [Gaiellaceae bacterium]